MSVSGGEGSGSGQGFTSSGLTPFQAEMWSNTEAGKGREGSSAWGGREFQGWFLVAQASSVYTLTMP